jgi:aspartate carbamoyltransferase catalytic subunit
MSQPPPSPQALAAEAGGKIQGDYAGRDILTVDQFAREDLHVLFALAAEMKRLVVEHQPSSLLTGYLVALLFFEPSSRTFASFASAVKRLGGQTLEHQNPAAAVAEGESLEDAILTLAADADALVLRHPLAGSARRAADAMSIPVVNAGDGNNEHPTQTLLDLFTIYEHFGRLDHLTCLLAGDPLNSRVIHSMIRGLSLFEANVVYLLSPEQLRLKRENLVGFREQGVGIVEIDREEDIPAQCDLWYWTRIQKERFASSEAYEEAMKRGFRVTPELLATRAGKGTILMDPLPRVATIDPAVDADERAVYFRAQIRNGLYIRMALLALVLGRTPS